MRSYCTSWWRIFKWNENSDWSHVKVSFTFIVTRLHWRLFCSSCPLRPLLPSLHTYTVRMSQEEILVIRIGLKRGRQHCTRTRLVLLWHVHESRTSVSVRVFRKKDHYFHPSRYLLELHPIIQNALVSVFKSCDGEIYLKPRPDWSPLGVRPLRLIGYWLVALEGEGSNCFSITQLVRQKRQ